MILEKVAPHPYRDDIYLNEIITPFSEIKESEKIEVNHILFEEVPKLAIGINF